MSDEKLMPLLTLDTCFSYIPKKVGRIPCLPLIGFNMIFSPLQGILQKSYKMFSAVQEAKC